MKRSLMYLCVVATAAVVSGCAISDSVPCFGHKTQAEAKLYGTDIAFSGFGAPFDGTYAYTVQYNDWDGAPNPDGVANPPPGNIVIRTYMNPIVACFNRDGIVDRDGDDIHGKRCSTTGCPATKGPKWGKAWVYDDQAPGCQFPLNLKQNFKGVTPAVLLCFTAHPEEIDAKDLSLQASFGSLDELLTSIWSGALTGDFTLEATGVTLDGASYPIDTLSIEVSHNGVKPVSLAIHKGPGASSLIQTLIDNTRHLEPVNVGLSFEGGLSIDVPVTMRFAFDHDRLWELL